MYIYLDVNIDCVFMRTSWECSIITLGFENLMNNRSIVNTRQTV